MIRLLLFFALAALPLYPQNPATAAFPTTVAVDQNLLAAKRLSESTLNGSINASTTTVVVSDGTQFLNWQIVRIDSEEMLIQSVSSNTLTIVSGGRGYNGTTAASHTTGAAVRGIITSWHHNQLAAEVKAIETRLRNVTGQCVDAGSTDDYACSPAPPFTSYATGMIVNFKAATANTGAATVNFNSIGAGAIKKVAGGVTTALDDNDIRAGQWVTVVYDGTNFQMISALGNAGSSSGSGISSCVPSGASGTAYTCTASPAVGSLTTGLTLAFKPDVASTGSVTLNVSGLGVKNVIKLLPFVTTAQAGSGDLKAGAEYILVYNGTDFYISGFPSPAYTYISDEGSAITPQRTILNMVGAGVTCVDNSGNSSTDCTIPADAVKSGSNTWSGANDFSGATSFVVRFGTTAPASGDCDAAGERGNVYVRTGDPATIATRVSVCTQTGASTYAWNPISHKVGTTAPATCVIGEIFFDSDATAGSNWLGCTATDTWTTQGSGSGGAPTGAQYLTLATDATLTAERVLTPDANMSVTDAGAGGAYTFGPDTAKILSRATAQAGALRVASSTGSDTYTGTATPTLTTYTDGMVVEFEATATANTGAASLNIDTLGAVNIKLCDGSTDPATGDIAVGKQVPLRYDGTVFRLPCNPATVSGGTSAFSSLTGGTNTGAAMIVGAGASHRANAADATAPNKSGTSLPSPCSVGDTYIKTDNVLHEQHYVCSSGNVWTIQGMKQPTSLLFFPFGPVSATAGTAFTGANQVNYYAWVPTVDYTPSTLRAFMTSAGGDVGDMAWGIYDSGCNKLYQTDTIAGASTQDRNTWTFASPTKLVAGTLYYIAFASNNASSSVFITVGGYWNYIAGDGFFFRGSEASSTSAGVTTLPATCGTKTEFFTESLPAITIR